MINDLNISPLQDLLNLYNVTHPLDMHTERLQEHHRVSLAVCNLAILCVSDSTLHAEVVDLLQLIKAGAVV